MSKPDIVYKRCIDLKKYLKHEIEELSDAYLREKNYKVKFIIFDEICKEYKRLAYVYWILYGNIEGNKNE